MRGRKPKPTHLKLVQGNPGKRALNDQEPPAPPAIPKPPSYLTKEAKREWRSLAPMLKAAGLLTNLDGNALGLLCSAIARSNEAERELAANGSIITTPSGIQRVSPWALIANKASKQVIALCVEFGMTPSARTRVKVDLKPLEDDFDRYLRGGPMQHQPPMRDDD
jgi:P27 family predicted phage terminase small subunit